MGNVEFTRPTKKNPLGITKKYFEQCGLDEAKTVIMFEILETYQTGWFLNPDTQCKYVIDIVQPKSKLKTRFETEFTPFLVPKGTYLTSKTEGQTRVDNDKECTLLNKHKIRYNHKESYYEPLIVEEQKPQHKDEETQIEPIECCVCALNKKCIFFEKCKHMPVCYSCSVKLNGKCPLCRVENQSTSIVFY